MNKKTRTVPFFKAFNLFFLSAIFILIGLFSLASLVGAVEKNTQAIKETSLSVGGMDMVGAVNGAIKANKGLEANYYQSQASESVRKSARGSFGPSLHVSYGYQRQSVVPGAAGAEADKALYSWAFTIKQPVFTGFNLLSTYQKAALQRDYDQAAWHNAELQLTLLVQGHFLSLLQARENVRSAEDSLDRLKAQLNVAEALFEVGVVPKLDVLEAKAKVSEAEDSLLRAKNSVLIEEAKLNTLLNLPVESDINYVGTLEYIPFESGLEQCLQQAFSSRPDLQMAAKSIEIAAKDKKIVASGFYPQISAFFQTQSQGDTFKAAGSTHLKNNYTNWSYGFSLDWALFEWGKTYYMQEHAGFIVSKMRAQEEDLRQTVSFEIKSNLLNLVESKERIKVAQDGVTQAKEAFRMVKARYEAQVATSTDVLSAQATLTSAETSLTRAKADYLLSLSKLFVSIGEVKPGLL